MGIPTQVGKRARGASSTFLWMDCGARVDDSVFDCHSALAGRFAPLTPGVTHELRGWLDGSISTARSLANEPILEKILQISVVGGDEPHRVLENRAHRLRRERTRRSALQ